MKWAEELKIEFAYIVSEYEKLTQAANLVVDGNFMKMPGGDARRVG